MPYSRKRSLSGIGLETMMPGIEFGAEATVAVFDRMYAAARGMDHDKIVVGNVTAQEVVQAIDTLLPVTSGVRQASAKLMGWMAPASTGVAMRHSAVVKICL